MSIPAVGSNAMVPALSARSTALPSGEPPGGASQAPAEVVP